MRPGRDGHGVEQEVCCGAEIESDGEADDGSCGGEDAEPEKGNYGKFDAGVDLYVPEERDGTCCCRLSVVFLSPQRRRLAMAYINAQNQSETMETTDKAKLKPVMLLWALQEPPETAFQFIWMGVQWKNS